VTTNKKRAASPKRVSKKVKSFDEHDEHIKLRQSELLPWFASSVDKVSELMQKQRLHHALLCNTSGKYGADNLAHHLSALLLCLDVKNYRACGECKTCLLFKSDTHPDHILIEDDGAIIKVDQIRGIIDRVAQRSQLGGNTVLVLEKAERMNLNSANALLKMLEEPPENTYFILTTESLSQLLPTIRSRCLSLSINKNDNQEISAWLAEQKIGIDVFSMARQQPILAKQLNTAVWQDVKTKLYAALATSSVVEFSEAMKNESLDKVIWWLNSLCETNIRSTMAGQVSQGSPYFYSANVQDLFELSDMFVDINRKLTNHVNYNSQLVLEDVFIKIKPFIKL
jgi:DNA polymerase III subunit delta'